MSFGENLNELVAKSTNELHSVHLDWERVKLGDVAELTNGFAFKSKGFNEQVGTPIVRIRDVTKGAPGTLYRGAIDDPKMTFIEDGQIAIGMDGDFNSRVWSGGRALLNQRVCTLEADEDVYSQKFLAYVLPGYLKLINDHTSSVTVKHLSSLTVRDIPLPLPPKNEQQRIVEKIETLFARLDKGEEALRDTQKLLIRYRQSVLKAAVTGDLTADWRAENSRPNWKNICLGDVTDFLTSGSRGWAKYYADSGDTFIRAQNLKHDKLDLQDVAYVRLPDKSEGKRTRVRLGDLLITITGANVTKTALVQKEIGTAYVSQHVALFRPNSEVRPEFLYWVIVAEAAGRKQLENYAYGAGKPGLNLSNIREVKLKLPSLQEQQVIVDRINDVMDQHAKIASAALSELARSTNLRQSILKEAFAGRLVPQDPNDEPATDLLARIKATRDAESQESKLRTQERALK